MEKYQLLNQVGAGSFGRVWKAFNKHSGEVVAIKMLREKFHSWEECLSLEEIKSLKILRHPNIVLLKEVIRTRDSSLFFVFEYMEGSLLQVMRSRLCCFSENEVRHWCFQVLKGLCYMHEKGYFHRDLKPENLLVFKDLIKIGDMGSAKEINSSQPCTDNVTTRINVPDQIFKICNVLGSPTIDSWLEGLVLARGLNYQFPQSPGVNLSLLMPSASENAISLIKSLCSWDPRKRPTASEALRHPFFHSCYDIPLSLSLRASVSTTTIEESTQLKGDSSKISPLDLNNVIAIRKLISWRRWREIKVFADLQASEYISRIHSRKMKSGQWKTSTGANGRFSIWNLQHIQLSTDSLLAKASTVSNSSLDGKKAKRGLVINVTLVQVKLEALEWKHRKEAVVVVVSCSD
ncbi:hypothetical protein JRO89_XS11G0227500 [Xanthoceras sorbifolium]|uniref:Protein kinase domain-containing protein n=1 Tax=Xanthoceras sorbifolium TaxID=99658 RepID=A0ABQ8HGV1_9ROSI|nr:hypothetical protein JRO89_XS11G0227500 [Xanthoceras sorbifolium]